MSGAQKFFVSRAGADAAFAAEIGRILEADGHKVKLQQWDFANSNFMLEMHEALTSGARVIALLSPEHMASDHCKAEWLNLLADDPLNRKHRLIVLRVARCEPEGMLAGISYWDLVPIRDNAVLVEEVVRDAVNVERRSDKVAATGPYWRAPRTVIDFEGIRPTPSFTGRERELSEIDVALWKGSNVAVVNGLSGTGKSILAREYAWQNRDRYSVVWRLNAETEAGIIDGLLRFAAQLVPGFDKTADLRAAAVHVTATMLTGFENPVLLVFDNLEDRRLWRTWCPPPGVHALLTSINRMWGANVTPVPLDTWPLPDAVRYLVTESNRSDIAPAAELIAAELGCLPLALSHAASHLGRARTITAQNYLQRIKTYLNEVPSDAEYPRAVFATFQAAIETAEERTPGAAAIVSLAAFFAPDAIPEELFERYADPISEELQPALTRQGMRGQDLRSTVASASLKDTALGELDRLSLVVYSSDNRTFGVHRLVQLAARSLLAEDESRWVLAAVSVAAAAFPRPDYEMWRVCERLMPHARAALQALPRTVKDRSAALLAFRCGRYLRLRAVFAEAESLLERAIEIEDALQDGNSPGYARMLNELAGLFKDKNEFAKAEKLYRRTLAIVEDERYGGEDSNLATYLNNLAGLLRRMNRMSEAESFYRRSLAIYEAAFGPNHPRIATALSNLGIVLRTTNRSAEAEQLFRRALKIAEEAHGHEHPEVEVKLNNLGSLLRETRRFVEAEQVLRRSLAIAEACYGPDHPSISINLNNLAGVLCDTNRGLEAEPLLRRALSIDEASYGPEHGEIATDLNNLGRMLFDAEHYAEAEALLRRALTIAEACYGAEHPAVYRTTENLAAVLVARGQVTEAESLYKRLPAT